jgi:intracellular septation protein A
MAESVLMIAQHADEELHELRRKFHPHHDYLNLIIPSTWFLIGLFVADFYFYSAAHLEHMLNRVREVQPYFAAASTSLEFFLALLLFIVAFTVIYVIGQIINGISALVLDRVLVKKLLKYPFELYLRRCRAPENVSNRRLFRDAVLESSYLIFCLNLVPLVFLELVATFFSLQVPELRMWLSTHSLIVVAILPPLLYLHFGLPSIRKPRRYPEDDASAAIEYERLAAYHLFLLIVLFYGELLIVAALGWAFMILLLPLINIAVGLTERLLRRGDEYRSDSARRVFFYLRMTFTNLLYFAAKLVGYGELPSIALIRSVRDPIVQEWSEREFFWMTYLTVQNRGGPASQTVYHFLAMYGIVRNLCNATAFILLGSVVAFVVRWPKDNELAVVLWLLGLCCLMYALFARYLYMYGAYFNKYVLRVASFVEKHPHGSVANHVVRA